MIGPRVRLPDRRVCVGIAMGALTACSFLPIGPMPVVCDDGVPPNVCDGVQDRWHLMTDLPRSRIVRIEVECIDCNPAGAEMVYRAFLTDGAMSQVGEAFWVPDWADFPE